MEKALASLRGSVWDSGRAFFSSFFFLFLKDGSKSLIKGASRRSGEDGMRSRIQVEESAYKRKVLKDCSEWKGK